MAVIGAMSGAGCGSSLTLLLLVGKAAKHTWTAWSDKRWKAMLGMQVKPDAEACAASMTLLCMQQNVQWQADHDSLWFCTSAFRGRIGSMPGIARKRD